MYTFKWPKEQVELVSCGSPLAHKLGSLLLLSVLSDQGYFIDSVNVR